MVAEWQMLERYASISLSMYSKACRVYVSLLVLVRSRSRTEEGASSADGRVVCGLGGTMTDG